jgi:hypothetical protein
MLGKHPLFKHDYDRDGDIIDASTARDCEDG